MKLVLKEILTGVLWLIAALPLFILYGLSYVLAFFLYHVIRYRRKVVHTNLMNAFPEKSQRERNKIAKDFYLNLADIIHETVKFRHLSNKTLEQHVTIKNRELIDKLVKQNRSFILSMGHCGNWEWVVKRLSIAYPGMGNVVAKPLADPFFEHYMTQILRLRNIQGNIVPYKKIYRYLIKTRNNFSMNIIAGDQTPARGEITFWTTFLNQDTPFFMGTEKIAKSLDMPVVFMQIYHPKRGKYIIDLELITASPKTTKPNEITLKHIALLEQHIKQYPSTWLWSHKRWKHKMRPGEVIVK